MTLVNSLNGSAPSVSHNAATRRHPQDSYSETVIHPESFYGKLRNLYGNQVLKTQLDQLKKQGSYWAFNMKWHPAYDIRPLTGANTRTDGIPPSLFWESDIGKWIEGACYFLNSTDLKSLEYANEFKTAIQEIVDMISSTASDDGYLGIYFRLVDPAGRFKNLRDMHEMYNCGHLLEGALAHYEWSGSRQFLDIVIKYVDLLIKEIGPHKGQLHGYPGHPELELAVLRLYSVVPDPKYLEFGRYLLEYRGRELEDQDGDNFFVYEAKKRNDFVTYPTMKNIWDQSYNMSHIPLHKQTEILGHSVRALYLLTAAADLGDLFLEDAKRLWLDCVDNKMYATGGIGTEPSLEGFSRFSHYLPQSTDQGGCYAETCAAIACMMVSERLLSHQLDGKVRDILELCFLNAVLGGGSLDGKQFSYANKHATCRDEVATRKDWFEVCCCPPNLSRTLGMLGGYSWNVTVDANRKIISLDVYLFVSATRTITLPDGSIANATMESDMPWHGKTRFSLEAPGDWTWRMHLPTPQYAENIKLSETAVRGPPGYLSVNLSAVSTLSMEFDLPIQLLSPHPASGQDNITVKRGPIIYTAESVDNVKVDKAYPHFSGIGIRSDTEFDIVETAIENIPVIMLRTKKGPFVLNEMFDSPTYRVIQKNTPPRTWTQLDDPLVLVPWFARANRGGEGRLRTAFLRSDSA